MSARKLQQEIERCFKQVDIGVEQFDSQYEKYEQSTNASQRDKLVDNIKKECKKLQRLRDQIKTWAAGGDVKDKGPLQEKRELIESKMEAFKAVEKEMKTKAFSKEGLLANARLDPKEREKEELAQFLQDMVDKLSEQVESQEASAEQIHAQTKKSKKGDAGKTERVAELEHKTERHKWHQAKLELLRRRLENEDIEPEAVKAAEEDIRNYVENNSEVDFYEDDGIYDDFNLDEDLEGAALDRERSDSQDNGVPSEDVQEPTPTTDTAKSKPKTADATTGGRRPSQHIKSPLPALATLHTLPAASPAAIPSNMKPAPLPPKPPGETLKYASAAAAAAAAAGEMTSIGIAPLPAPPGKTATPAAATPALASAVPVMTTASSVSASPAASAAEPAASVAKSTPAAVTRSPSTSQTSISAPSPAPVPSQPVQPSQATQAVEKAPPSSATEQNGISLQPPEPIRDHDSGFESEVASPANHTTKPAQPQVNGADEAESEILEEDEAIYHLPASLRELLGAYDAVKAAATPVSNPAHQRMLSASFNNRPDTIDAEKPRHYKPANPALYAPPHYPHEPLPIFDDPRLYSKIDTDALFYSFYYRQGTYQQYLAAKSLKGQSWRFHKQYQTWFQRHEEPQAITEDFEKGTYRFFDYESTWMNRRKANFNFEYKFLEDDL